MICVLDEESAFSPNQTSESMTVSESTAVDNARRPKPGHCHQCFVRWSHECIGKAAAKSLLACHLPLNHYTKTMQNVHCRSFLQFFNGTNEELRAGLGTLGWKYAGYANRRATMAQYATCGVCKESSSSRISVATSAMSPAAQPVWMNRKVPVTSVSWMHF